MRKDKRQETRSGKVRSRTPKPEFDVRYYLRTARKGQDKKFPVYIQSAQNAGKQLRYDTGLRLLKSQWKSFKKNKNAQALELEYKLRQTYRDLVAKKKMPTLLDLIEHMDEKRKPVTREIVGWCDDYLKSIYSPGMKKAVHTLRSNLNEFRKGSLTFDDLNRSTLREFFDHLSRSGVANNSQYKRLRALVNVAAHASIDIPDLKNYRMEYSTKNALKARLSWKEVRAVIDTDTQSKTESVAKDVFLLACFSGLRISDILTLKQGELHDYHYERIQTKTKQLVLVTIHKYNEPLFRKYMAEDVGYTRQTLSLALKKVLERSGMTKKVVRYKNVGYNPLEISTEKFKEISFHSGRRFYARLLSDLELGEEITRDEMGHSFKNVTELYAGSPEHAYRIARVRKAMDSLEEKLEQLASLMKVA